MARGSCSLARMDGEAVAAEGVRSTGVPAAPSSGGGFILYF